MGDNPALPPFIPSGMAIKEALHIGIGDLPFVDLQDGSHMQLLQVDLNQGLWVVRMRFKPGCTLPKHKHTGPVFAVTAQGRWKYLEYPTVVNEAGSYLFEPAGSIHTLHVLADQAEDTVVWFAVFGSNLNLDADEAVASVVDAQSVLGIYRALAAGAGLLTDRLLVIGEEG